MLDERQTSKKVDCNRVKDTKGAGRSRSHTTADRVKQRMGVLFDWSIASGFRSGNPIHGITKVLPKHSGAENHFAALPYTEVP
jgi:hypothetical protein